MNPGVFLDVAASVLAVMMLFSLLASAINEYIADNLANLRGQKLEQAIRGLLEGNRLDPEAFFARTEILALTEREAWPGGWFRRGRVAALRGRRMPSAIEPRRYAVIALDLLLRRSEAADGIARLRATLPAYAAGGALDGGLERAEALTGEAQEATDRHLAALEADYAEVMARATGWYLRSVRRNLFLIGLVLAAGANVDFLAHARKSMLREDLVRQAGALEVLGAAGLAAEGQAARPARQVERLAAGLAALEMRAGWSCAGAGGGTVPFTGALCPGTGVGRPSASQVTGWLLVAFGVTLGAQFWFDLFRKVTGLRSAGRTLSGA